MTQPSDSNTEAQDSVLPMKGLAEAGKAAKRGLPPVERWDPPYCGEMDMRIAADGNWYHEGGRIGRLPLVQLFSGILIRQEGRYYLVTPVEKIGIRVDDAPFLAVAMQIENAGEADQSLVFTTNVGDTVIAGADTPLRFIVDAENGGLKPYLYVRRGLEALVTRALTYDLVDLASVERNDGEEMMGVRSGGRFFPVAPAGELNGA